MTAVAGWLVAFALVCATGALASTVMSPAAAARIIAWLGGVAGALLIVVGTGVLFAWPPYSAAIWTIPSLTPVMVRTDALTGVFLLITGLVSLPVSIFGADAVPALLARYNIRAYAVMYFALLAAIVWVLVAGDVFSFLVAWEVMSILCYLLVLFEDDQVSHRRAAYLMLAISEAGALAALIGLLILSLPAGSLLFADLRASGTALSGGLRLAVFLLTFFGFGVKAGLVPVNMWLPGAYAAAPAAFVPLLAGATLNLGLYGIIRVNADLLPPVSSAPGLITLIVGTISALVGILYATIENDMKVLLAHSSVENAGIVTVGLGAGFLFAASAKPVLVAIAFVVALYHLANHSIYKTLLFIGSGVVDARAGTRDLDRLGGVMRRMPWASLFILAGVLSIAALPPFNGFVSEWLTLQTLLRSQELPSVGVKIVVALCGAGLALTAALAVTCFAKLFAMGFLGMPRSPAGDTATDAAPASLAAMALLAASCLLLGVGPTYVIGALDRAVRPLAQSSATAALVPPFFAGRPGHDTLPAAFLSEFHDLGAQVGERIAPGPGLVILHRGGDVNPVVFAASPTYLIVVLAGLLGLTWVLVRSLAPRRQKVERRACWDGGVRRLLPEMTYTATGFSNPVRVIFQAVLRPTTTEDTRETLAEHFRAAIVRDDSALHVIDRLVLHPMRETMLGGARFVARMHHGRLNAYLAYALLSLIIALAAFMSW